MSEPRSSIRPADGSPAAWLIDRDGVVIAQSPLARHRLGDIVGADVRAVLAGVDRGGVAAQMFEWCLELGESHAMVLTGRTIRMSPTRGGVLISVDNLGVAIGGGGKPSWIPVGALMGGPEHRDPQLEDRCIA
jgi:hypothetical protein